MDESKRNTKSILLVEDESIVFSIQRTLQNRLGFPVRVARTVNEAVGLLSGDDLSVFVIIDIMMTPGDFPGEAPVNPLEAAFRLAEKIRDRSIPGSKTSSKVPILFFTGVSSTSLIEKCKALAGAANVFLKPTDLSRIVARIRETLNKKCLILGTKRDLTLVEKLEKTTPFHSVVGVSSIADCLRELAATQYAATIVLSELSPIERKRITELSRGIAPLIKPKLDSSLPALLARTV